jgi:hypothetical protein
MKMFDFVDQWFIEFPIEKTAAEIFNIAAYPTWWPGMEKTIVSGPIAPKTTADYFIKGYLPYTMHIVETVTKVDLPYSLDFTVDGDLAGNGRWELKSTPAGTSATLFWHVGTTRFFLNLLAGIRFFQPILAENHTCVMKNGEQALRCRLRAMALPREKSMAREI